MNLTAKTLASLKPKDKRYHCFDTNLPGFSVSVTPAGVKSFSVMYRHGAGLRRYTIGTEHQWSLADARDRAREVLRTAAKGQDPAGMLYGIGPTDPPTILLISSMFFIVASSPAGYRPVVRRGSTQ